MYIIQGFVFLSRDPPRDAVDLVPDPDGAVRGAAGGQSHLLTAGESRDAVHVVILRWMVIAVCNTR